MKFQYDCSEPWTMGVRSLSQVCATLLALNLVGGCASGPRGHSSKLPATQLVLEAKSADSDADVYIDGHYVGELGELGSIDGNPAKGPPKLAPGDHRVEVRKAGRFPAQHTLEIDRHPPGETRLGVELLSDPAR